MAYPARANTISHTILFCMSVVFRGERYLKMTSVALPLELHDMGKMLGLNFTALLRQALIAELEKRGMEIPPGAVV